MRRKPLKCFRGCCAQEPLLGRRRVVRVLAWAWVLLVAVEFGLQVRLQLQTGQSVFARVSGPSDFVIEPTYGLRLLQPDAHITGHRQAMRSNQLGLRSPQLSAVKAQGEYRVAVIGASSVMGAYSTTNHATLPAMLETRLRAQLPHVNLHVINAGIAGHTLQDEKLMLQYVADKLSPDVVILYPGSNDFAGYCLSKDQDGEGRNYALPQLRLPAWLVSVDLLLKNTTALRPVRVVGARVDPAQLDLAGYRRTLESMVRLAQARGIRIALSTNTRSYRPEQPPALQEELAQAAIYYNDCFDVAGLNTLHARHNEVIRLVGATLEVPVLPIDEVVPGGADHFHDSNHLNDRGKALVAEAFARFLDNTDWLERGGGE